MPEPDRDWHVSPGGNAGGPQFSIDKLRDRGNIDLDPGPGGAVSVPVLGSLPGHEDAPPIGPSGRVCVPCDASTGAIELGDMLTPSDSPGHAMKAANASRVTGAVVGKAMSLLAADKRGKVLVLVNLRLE